MMELVHIIWIGIHQKMKLNTIDLLKSVIKKEMKLSISSSTILEIITLSGGIN